jgi:hypothetical protein
MDLHHTRRPIELQQSAYEILLNLIITNNVFKAFSDNCNLTRMYRNFKHQQNVCVYNMKL